VDFVSWISQHLLEIVGTISGIAGVWLTTRQNIWCWPVALVNVSIYIIVFHNAKLYADFGLQVFYFIMTIYGWLSWKGVFSSGEAPPVSRLSLWKWAIFLAIGFLCTFFLGWMLETYTDASLPYFDSFTSVFGIIGTYLMARKIIDHWILWIVVDIICSIIYINKELYFTSGLYMVFTVLAIIGFVKWRKDLPTHE